MGWGIGKKTTTLSCGALEKQRTTFKIASMTKPIFVLAAVVMISLLLGACVANSVLADLQQLKTGATSGGSGQSGSQVVNPPTFKPPAGMYSSDQSVEISDSAGVGIHYTTDGSTPTVSSTLYSGPISVVGNGTTETLKAIGVTSGMTSSSVASATYVIDYNQVSTPSFSEAGGQYSTDQSITITDNTTGATIYYTVTSGTTGTTPTISSTVYSGAISISGNGTVETIEAIAVKSGMTNSTITPPATYSIVYGIAPAVSITPSGGAYSSDQTVKLSDSDSLATIYYTVTSGTSGTTPTTSSPVYSGSISVSGNGTVETIEAMAAASGITNSIVSSATYTISYPSIQLSPTSLSFSAMTEEPDAPSKTVSVSSQGGTLSGVTTNVNYSNGSGWLSVSLNTTSTPATLTVQPITQGSSLSPGTYSATVSILSSGANNSPQDIPVTLDLSQGPLISLSSTSLTFYGSYEGTTPGYGTPTAQSITVSNGGGGTLSIDSCGYTAASWLTFGAGACTGTAPFSFNVQASPGSLTPGTYTDTINMSGTGTQAANISITFNVVPSQVQNVQATQGTVSGGVIVSWSSAVGATSYTISRSTTPGGTRTEVGTTSGISFGDYTVASGTDYYYYIYAIDSGGFSSYISNYALGYD